MMVYDPFYTYYPIFPLDQYGVEPPHAKRNDADGGELIPIWLPEYAVTDPQREADINEACCLENPPGWFIVMDDTGGRRWYSGNDEKTDSLSMFSVPLPWLFDSVQYDGYFTIDDRIYILAATKEHRTPSWLKPTGNINLFFKNDALLPFATTKIKF